MTGQAPARDTGYIASLRVRDFRFLWASSMLSASGQWTLVVGRGWLMYELTKSSAWVGIVTFAGMVPFLLATPVGGMLADRIERRRLTVIMQAVSLIASAGLAGLVLAHVVQPWEVVALALLAGVGRSIETPATTSLIPNIVPMRYLLNAISLNSVATYGSRLIGPAAALLLHDTLGTGSVFMMTSVFYALAMLLMSGVMRPAELTRNHDSLWRQTLDTWKYIAVTPLLPVVFLLVGLHCGLTMSIDAVLPQVAANALHGGNSAYDVMVMSFGAGTMVGTFALGGLRSEETKGSLLWVTGLLSGIATAALAMTHDLLPAFLVMSIMGASQGMFMALGNTLVQEVVPDRLRGRVSGAYLMAGGGSMSIGNLIAGPAADRFGVQVVLLAPALLFLVAMVALSGFGPGLRRLYRTGTLAAAQQAVAAQTASA